MDERQGALESLDVTGGPLPNGAFWAGKRVLLTGHTGFKGSWAAAWLASMGAQVTGFALEPETEPSLFRLADAGRGVRSLIGDLRDRDAVAAAVRAADPQIVIHMAAQPLVKRAVANPAETFASNVLGTAHLLDALRDERGLEAVVVITSDKVYANDELGRPFVEADALGGKDPYSASKAATELAVGAFAQSYFDRAGVPVATARGGNVIGGGDFSADRLIPDLIRAVLADRPLALRHPQSTRPWQHVLDCLCGYLLFAEALAQRRPVPRALNFGPAMTRAVKVAELADAFLAAVGSRVGWHHVPDPDSIEMKTLILDSAKARTSLGWRERLGGRRGIEWTADWYRAYREGADLRAMTVNQIKAYGNLQPVSA